MTNKAIKKPGTHSPVYPAVDGSKETAVYRTPGKCTKRPGPKFG